MEFLSRAEREYVKSQVERIAEKIRITRKAQNMTQERLAELISASASTVKAIERNQRAPSLPMLFKILYVLDRHAKVW